MTDQEIFDKYEILKALFANNADYNQSVADNPLYSDEFREKIIQRNNKIYMGLVARFLHWGAVEDA